MNIQYEGKKKKLFVLPQGTGNVLRVSEHTTTHSNFDSPSAMAARTAALSAVIPFGSPIVLYCITYYILYITYYLILHITSYYKTCNIFLYHL